MKKTRLNKLTSSEQGVALVVALLMLVLLTALGIAATNTSIVEGWLSLNYRTTNEAFYAAEAGIQDAISRLINGTVSDSGSENVTDWNVNNSYSSTNFNNTFTITHRLVGNPSAVATDPDTGEPYYLITSTGTSGSAQKTLKAVVSLTYSSSFEKAIVGCDGIESDSNAETDSYSSAGNTTDGLKGSIGTTNNDADINLDSNAEIKGDVYAVGNLELNSNAKIYKSAYSNKNISMDSNSKIGYADRDEPYTYEAKASGNISLGNNAKIYGDKVPNASTSPVSESPCDPLNIDNIFSTTAVPIKTTNNNNDTVGGLDPDYYNDGNKTYKIGSGSENPDTIGLAGESKEYYLTKFSMNSHAEVIIQGDVTIYIDGEFSMDSNTKVILPVGATLTIYVTEEFSLNSNAQMNNLNESAGIPANLMVYSNGDEEIEIKSNALFRGVVYAPKAEIELDSKNVYGAMRGKSVRSKTKFHYDEELKNIAGGKTPNGHTSFYFLEPE